ncbi:CUB and sushi domain-containing protein 2-like [Notothenia coriiceps]|uniref:CUB and sushi domain-containing protein 2-like n=1 Tax=Notothenia coriiceps TaxID=8208 RepID=A0A6I9Q2R6_9TELE|nr:PREDICTED: CUB and sushi domain-containing protein 2-like [Notothenia coriiceps]
MLRRKDAPLRQASKEAVLPSLRTTELKRFAICGIAISQPRASTPDVTPLRTWSDLVEAKAKELHGAAKLDDSSSTDSPTAEIMTQTATLSESEADSGRQRTLIRQLCTQLYLTPAIRTPSSSFNMLMLFSVTLNLRVFAKLRRTVTAESDQKTFVYQGHTHSKDFGKFHLTRQGPVTMAMDPSNPYTNSSSVAAAILVPFFALILSGFAFYLYKHRSMKMSAARTLSAETDDNERPKDTWGPGGRTRPKVQFNGYVGHESSNGQASFENPMYDTNMKPTEAKAVRFDTTLNTVCTVV